MKNALKTKQAKTFLFLGHFDTKICSFKSLDVCTYFLLDIFRVILGKKGCRVTIWWIWSHHRRFRSRNLYNWLYSSERMIWSMFEWLSWKRLKSSWQGLTRQLNSNTMQKSTHIRRVSKDFTTYTYFTLNFQANGWNCT